MNPWVIVLCVVVLLCCLCFGGLGLLLAFGEDLLSMFVFQLAPLALLA
jgi:cell shape-determining protein MreD